VRLDSDCVPVGGAFPSQPDPIYNPETSCQGFDDRVGSSSQEISNASRISFKSNSFIPEATEDVQEIPRVNALDADCNHARLASLRK
jgi:hypothetical protein